MAYDPFFRLKYLSNYHLYMTKQWPTEALHQFHLIELVIALRMVISWSISGVLVLLGLSCGGEAKSLWPVILRDSPIQPTFISPLHSQTIIFDVSSSILLPHPHDNKYPFIRTLPPPCALFIPSRHAPLARTTTAIVGRIDER